LRQIVVFSIVFGIALAVLNEQKQKPMRDRGLKLEASSLLRLYDEVLPVPEPGMNDCQ